jgi:hypothetical protein
MLRWDPQKAASNLAKHGISFDEASTVFQDPDGLGRYDEGHADVEPRHQRVGKSVLGRVLLVVYTMRRTDDDKKEEKRIISARQASRKERAAYSRQ